MSFGPPDTTELENRLARHLEAGERIASLDRLPGGLSGITYLLSCDGGATPRRLVVKVAPQGVPPTGNRDVLRQASIQEFLTTTGTVPVPSVAFTDPGEPQTPPFYASEFVDGDSCEPLDEDTSPVPGPSTLHRRYLHAAQVLAHLHAMPATSPFFSGVPTITPDQELARWRRVFEATSADLRFDSDELGRRLASSTPDPLQPTLVHGDYRLGNTICAGEEVRVVIDWELWGLGDPRTDLAWLLHMSDPDVRTARRQVAGVPTRAEIVEAYRGCSGMDVSQLTWFEALALFKRAAATALIVKHNRRSENPDPLKEKAVEVIEPLLVAVEAITSDSERGTNGS